MPETLTVTQSPRNQFQTLEQSQQIIHQDDTIQFAQSFKVTKIIPELIKTKVYIVKDKVRKKSVWIELKIHEYNQQDSIIPDETKYCRICLCDDGNSDLIRPCKCKGSLQLIHENCLKAWILEKQGIEKVMKNEIECEVCHSAFKMETQSEEKRMPRLIKQATRGRLICWAFEILIAIAMAGTIIFLIMKVIYGPTDPLILAGITVLIIFLFLLLAAIYVSCIDQMTVEVLLIWKFVEVRSLIQSICGSKPTSKIDLEDQNKQTIQTPPRKRRSTNMKRSAIIRSVN